MQKIAASRWIFGSFLVLGFAATVYASGATFAVTGQGVKLSEGKETEEGGKEVIRIETKAEVGKAFTLTAQGMVMPRGGAAQPGEPEEGKWTIDEKHFKRVEAPKDADKTKISIRIEPTKVGSSHVRFAGKILGYERNIDIVVEVTAKK
jgi:hypothetical protein